MPEKRRDDIPDLDNEARCSITLVTWDELKQPVYVQQDKTGSVYEFEDLCKWWIEHGTDSFRTKIEPSHWFKLI